MTLSYRARRILSVLVLIVLMPIYIILVAWLLAALPRLPILVEVAIYVLAGFGWILPFRFVFRGVGKPDPDKAPPKYLDDQAIARDRAKTREMP